MADDMTHQAAIEVDGHLVTYGAVGMGRGWQAQIELWARGTGGKLLHRWMFDRIFERFPDAIAFAEREAKEVAEHPKQYARPKTRGWADSTAGGA
jgi:hypothetical protein